jgi:excisionase family DNA binding protein
MSNGSLQVPPDKAAAMLGISRSMLYKLLRSQRIPLKPVKLGTKVLFPVHQIKQFVESGCRRDFTPTEGKL